MHKIWWKDRKIVRRETQESYALTDQDDQEPRYTHGRMIHHCQDGRVTAMQMAYRDDPNPDWEYGPKIPMEHSAGNE